MSSKLEIVALVIATSVPASLLAIDNAEIKSVLSLVALLLVVVIMKISGAKTGGIE